MQPPPILLVMYVVLNQDPKSGRSQVDMDRFLYRAMKASLEHAKSTQFINYLKGFEK